MEDTLTDFALAAYREEGRWEVAPLPPHAGDGLEHLLAALRQLPAEGGLLGLVSIADDFFVAVRVAGGATRMLLSDASAATEWPIAREVLDVLHLPLPDEDDTDPAGDLGLVADLGVDALELGAILDDLDLYPDEVLGQVARRLGFGDQFERALDVVAR